MTKFPKWDELPPDSIIKILDDIPSDGGVRYVSKEEFDRIRAAQEAPKDDCPLAHLPLKPKPEGRYFPTIKTENGATRQWRGTLFLPQKAIDMLEEKTGPLPRHTTLTIKDTKP